MLKVLITGANRGIGLALSRALVSQGHFVYGGARKPKSAERLQELLEHHSAQMQVLPLDVTATSSVQEAVQSVRKAGRGLDVLVNNAGALLEPVDAGFSQLDIEWFDRTFAVNVTGAARVTQAFLPFLSNSPSPRIVNVSSGAGSTGGKTNAHYYCYGASKAALNHLTIVLAHELRPGPVIVVAVSPGWVRTDMGGSEAELSAKESAYALAKTILTLTMAQSGCFLDRFGRTGTYEW
jgi:NAD(P)-dependent dehydrogenase (short-subunit alcohol dehydrogenase family)